MKNRTKAFLFATIASVGLFAGVTPATFASLAAPVLDTVLRERGLPLPAEAATMLNSPP